MRQYLNIANVNVFGMVRTTRAFLPLIRQAKGRIVYVSSIKGQISTPLNAAYNIAKYGVETFGDIVRLEMSQFGVKVVVIEPGNFGKITGCLNPDGSRLFACGLCRVAEVGLVVLVVLAVYFALTTPTVLCLAVLAVLWGVYRRERKRAAGTIPLTGKHVLITGCDSGFGHGLAKQLHALDCHVIATVLQPEGKGAKELRDVKSPRMTVLPLDVGSDESVSACLHAVREMCGNTGRIVNVTSIKGQVSTPYNAAYNITKYGGETFSDILRLEMSQFGVKVVIIEPGNFGGATGCINAEARKRIGKDFDEMWADASDDVKQLFSREHLDRLLKSLEPAALETYPTLTPVLDTIAEALTSDDPDLRYIIDGSNKLIDRYCLLVRVKPFVSDRMFDRLVSYYFPYSIEK
nr:hypothetical protein BaRGS_000381 [Batillaria attramentaria]